MLGYQYYNLLASKQFPAALTLQQLTGSQLKVTEAHAEILADRKADILGFYNLPESDTNHITDYLAKLDNKFDTMVVLGIGGSALGNKALYSALKTEAELPKKIYVYDNVDPVFLHEILQSIKLETTLFNIITKSGTTAETMAGYMILVDIVKRKFPQDYQQRIIITTDQDFEEMIWREERQHEGVLRLENLPRVESLSLLEYVLNHHSQDLASGSIIIALSRKIRIRKPFSG